MSDVLWKEEGKIYFKHHNHNEHFGDWRTFVAKPYVNGHMYEIFCIDSHFNDHGAWYAEKVKANFDDGVWMKVDEPAE